MSHKTMWIGIILAALVAPVESFATKQAPSNGLRAHCIEASNINLGILELRLVDYQQAKIHSLVLAHEGLVGPLEREDILINNYAAHSDEEVQSMAAKIENGKQNKFLSEYYFQCIADNEIRGL